MSKQSTATTRDLFGGAPSDAPKGNVTRLPVQKPGESYTAADIEVLEGLEPVRRRPGMYIGGTDEKALHHLFAEVHRQRHGRSRGGPCELHRRRATGRRPL